MDILKIGIIGAGENTKKLHLPKLQSLPGIEIREVANRSLESSNSVAEKFGIPVVRNSWQEVAQSPELDAIVIGTWPYLHCAATCMSLKSGKHVLCEARMAMNQSEAEKMLKTSERFPGLTAQLVPAPFSLHADSQIKEMINNKEMGEVRHFQVNYLSPASPGKELHWRRNKKYSGMNVMTLGIIYESLLRWLPPAKWVKAEARTFNSSAMENGVAVPVEIPDYLSVQMSLENNIPGVFLISEASNYKETPQVKISGDKATLILELVPDGKLWLVRNGKENLVSISEKNKGRWKVEEEFINSIRDRKPFTHTSFSTGLEYMKFTEAVYRSYKNNGTRVPVS